MIQKELFSCQKQLSSRESELQEKVYSLEKEALARKQVKDIAGAKKRLIERRRVQAQLEKLQNSMATIELHRNTIEGSVLDRAVLETLRASGDALKQMGASTGGIRAVEEIVADVEAQMENAAEITKIISTGSVSGMVNSMALDGISIDDDELMRELDSLETESSSGMALLEHMPVLPTPLASRNSQYSQQQHATNPIPPLPAPTASKNRGAFATATVPTEEIMFAV